MNGTEPSAFQSCLINLINFLLVVVFGLVALFVVIWLVKLMWEVA